MVEEKHVPATFAPLIASSDGAARAFRGHSMVHSALICTDEKSCSSCGRHTHHGPFSRHASTYALTCAEHTAAWSEGSQRTPARRHYRWG